MSSIVRRALGALKRLLRWRTVLVAVFVLVAIAVGYGAYTLLGGSSQTALEENQRELPVRMGVLTREISIDGSIVFPEKETLTFASRGFVDEILVSEGEEVKAGQTLARLDAESVAALRQAAAQAELDLLKARDDLAAAENPTLLLAESRQAVLDVRAALRAAQRELDTLLNPPAHALAQARAAEVDARAALRAAQRELDTLLDPPAHALAQASAEVVDARAAVRAAWRELDTLLNPSDHTIAQAESMVVEAEAALRDARERLTNERGDAQAQVDAALEDLDLAKRRLVDARDDSGYQEHRKAIADAERKYAQAVRKWTGADLTEDELALSPSALFEAWRLDPDAAYERGYDPFAGGEPRDDPATRWNEITVYAWTAFYPAPDSIRATCGDSELLPVGAGGGEPLCVLREINSAWESLDEARGRLSRALVQHETGIAEAEVAVLRSERSLAEAEKALAGLDGGPRVKLLLGRLDLAESNLAKAEADLDKLSAPDPVEVEAMRDRAALAEANLAQAEADLTRLSAPDPVEVEAKRDRAALAEASLAQAESDLARLSAPDPVEVETRRGRVAVAEASLAEAEVDLERLTARRELEVTLRETALIAAQANLDGAVSRLENSTLKAPWDGYVSKILVEKNEEISAADAVLELIDYVVVEVDGRVDEFEVLELERGAVASVRLDALPDQMLEGVVSNISTDASNERGSATFNAKVKFVLPDGLRIQEGLRATAKVSLGEERGLLVPNPAIRGTYDHPAVLVVGGVEVEERAVVLGSTDGFWTVVREGLAEGELVAVELGRPGEGVFGTEVTVGGPQPEEEETIVVEEP